VHGEVREGVRRGRVLLRFFRPRRLRREPRRRYFVPPVRQCTEMQGVLFRCGKLHWVRLRSGDKDVHASGRGLHCFGIQGRLAVLESHWQHIRVCGRCWLRHRCRRGDPDHESGRRRRLGADAGGNRIDRGYRNWNGLAEGPFDAHRLYGHMRCFWADAVSDGRAKEPDAVQPLGCCQTGLQRSAS